MIGHSKHLALNTLDRSCPSIDCKDKIDVPDRIGPLPRTESAAFPGPPSRPKSCGTVTDRPQSTQALATPWVEHGEQVASGATSPSAPAPTPPSQALGAATTRALPCANVDLKDAYIQVPLDETEIPICKLTPNHTSYVPQPPGDAARRHGGVAGLESDVNMDPHQDYEDSRSDVSYSSQELAIPSRSNSEGDLEPFPLPSSNRSWSDLDALSQALITLNQCEPVIIAPLDARELYSALAGTTWVERAHPYVAIKFSYGAAGELVEFLEGRLAMGQGFSQPFSLRHHLTGIPGYVTKNVQSYLQQMGFDLATCPFNSNDRGWRFGDLELAVHLENNQRFAQPLPVGYAVGPCGLGSKQQSIADVDPQTRSNTPCSKQHLKLDADHTTRSNMPRWSGQPSVVGPLEAMVGCVAITPTSDSSADRASQSATTRDSSVSPPPVRRMEENSDRPSYSDLGPVRKALQSWLDATETEAESPSLRQALLTALEGQADQKMDDAQPAKLPTFFESTEQMEVQTAATSIDKRDGPDASPTISSVFIRSWDGATLSLPVHDHTEWYDLVDGLVRRTGIPRPDFALIHEGRILPEAAVPRPGVTLSTLGIRLGDVLHMTMRLRGGMPQTRRRGSASGLAADPAADPSHTDDDDEEAGPATTVSPPRIDSENPSKELLDEGCSSQHAARDADPSSGHERERVLADLTDLCNSLRSELAETRAALTCAEQKVIAATAPAAAAATAQSHAALIKKAAPQGAHFVRSHCRPTGVPIGGAGACAVGSAIHMETPSVQSIAESETTPTTTRQKVGGGGGGPPDDDGDDGDKDPSVPNRQGMPGLPRPPHRAPSSSNDERAKRKPIYEFSGINEGMSRAAFESVLSFWERAFKHNLLVCGLDEEECVLHAIKKLPASLQRAASDVATTSDLLNLLRQEFVPALTILDELEIERLEIGDMSVPQYTRKIRDYGRRLEASETQLARYFVRGLRNDYPALFTRLTVDYADATLEELTKQAQLIVEADRSAKNKAGRGVNVVSTATPDRFTLPDDPVFERNLRTLVAAIQQMPTFNRTAPPPPDQRAKGPTSGNVNSRPTPPKENVKIKLDKLPSHLWGGPLPPRNRKELGREWQIKDCLFCDKNKRPEIDPVTGRSNAHNPWWCAKLREAIEKMPNGEYYLERMPSN